MGQKCEGLVCSVLPQVRIECWVYSLVRLHVVGPPYVVVLEKLEMERLSQATNTSARYFIIEDCRDWKSKAPWWYGERNLKEKELKNEIKKTST